MADRDGDAPLVVVVDDDDAMRHSVGFLLASVKIEARLFASAEAFLAGREALPKDRPGCLLLDVRMPGMNGLELQRMLGERKCRLPILMVTAHGDIPMAVAALKAGAEDFIEKPYRDQQLLDAVHAAIRKSRNLLIQGNEHDAVVERFGRLTRREREVMLAVAAGKPNKIIALDLDISIKTVEVHRHSGMEKMRAGSAAELSRMIALAGLPGAGD